MTSERRYSMHSAWMKTRYRLARRVTSLNRSRALQSHASTTIEKQPQDERLVTRAPHAEALKRADSGMGVVFIRPSKHIEERSAVKGTISNRIH